MDGWGYELSEPVAVTGGGVSRFTDLRQELTVKQTRGKALSTARLTG
jgi:ectoine hydrolase